LSEARVVTGKVTDRPSEFAEPALSPAAHIRATLASKITFASHQNDVPTILDLAVDNTSDDDLDGLTLTVKSDPAVLGERTWTIDRIAARSQLRPKDVRVPLAGGLLDKLTDRLRSDVTFTLRKGEFVLAEEHMTVEALARNEWGGSRFMPELLAAFVTPNDSTVQHLLKESSDILASSGRDGSIDGYQKKSRERVWEVMSGVWAAVSARAITYAVPPASFETTGQKIRLPSEIEKTGLSTCLDTALLFAAAFEQAGLHPVVVFTKEHALAGAWLQPQYFPTLTVDDPIIVRKAIALKELVIFETTLATTGHPIPFTKAIAEAERQLAEENDAQFVYAVDVRQARRRGIQPLSSLASTTDTHSRAAQPRGAAPPLDVPPDLPVFDPPVELDESERTPEERLAIWRRSLLDLSKRNRLLNLKPSASAIPIFCPDPSALEDKIAEGKRIHIIAPPARRDAASQADETLFRLRTGDDWSVNFARDAMERGAIVANTDEKQLEKGTIELYRKAKADFEEGGSNTLFLALGMLRWTPSGDKTRYSAPMILMPVRLERASARSKPYILSHDDDTVFNLTLLQMLRQDFGINLSELSGELPKDRSGVDVRNIWNHVRHKVKDVPGFEVVEEVFLSTFSFAKYLMWKDLTDRTETLKGTPFVRHLIETPRDPYPSGTKFLDPKEIDRKVEASSIFAPLNADSSQIVAIHASGLDGDFVLEGPPGTGKSETIGNIIAHNIALGRKVLFVSEKMAALEVVYKRLVAAGLGDFCLELHSSKANKRAILDQLDAAWKRRGEHSPAEWKKTATHLADLRGRLNGLVDALHQPGPAGISPRDAIGRSLRYGDLHRVELDWPKNQGPVGLAPDAEAFADLCEVAKRLGQRFSQIEPEDMDAFPAVLHGEWSFAWQSRLIASARRLGVASQDLLSARLDLIGQLGLDKSTATLGEARAFSGLVGLLPDCERANLSFALTADNRETLAKLRALIPTLAAYRERRGSLSPAYVEEKIAIQPLQRWSTERSEAEGKSFLFKGSAVKKLRTGILDAFGLTAAQVPEPERDLEALTDLRTLQDQLTQLEDGLPAGTPWRGLKTDVTVLERDLAAGESLRSAVQRLAGEGRDFITLRGTLSRKLCDGRDMLEPGSAMDRAARRFVAALAEFETASSDFRELSGAPSVMPEEQQIAPLTQVTAQLIERERRLNPWCGWIMVKREAEAKGLATLVTGLESGAIRHDQVVDGLRTAYCRWVAPELIDVRPELRTFSTIQHTSLIETFRKLDEEMSAMSADYIRAKLSGAVPGRNDLTADQGFGVLSRQLQRTIGHMPVRQLVGEMGQALTALTPCMLMSPLSVAQFLPADTSLFDLVVFDEASQITVPDAIGAIARGRRCIVVGDPRQMPPSLDFSKAPGSDDDGSDTEPDLDSILDEALAARVPLHRLTGHYRSRHESLIAFSNHAYYKGELVTFPSADTRDTAVVFHKVDGIYARGKGRTNPIEAQAVVAAALKHMNDPIRNELSLGIVTMNTQQQQLILDLLDVARRQQPNLERFFGDRTKEPVFVKNLETVQGDQRDIVLISVGFGPSEPGAATMSMDFGKLNRKGGERRLNVAITRATSEVMVFASFDPSMIDLTRTQAEAVRDLKHYLEFAAQGPSALGAAIRSMATNDYDSDFEMSVADGLRRLGWTVRTQIGVSKFRIDLGVIHPDSPGKFMAGVECDGATYHSSPSARDRDRVRQIILERLGWQLLRIWSTDWFIDPEARIQKLNDDLLALLEEDRRIVADRAANSVAQEEAPDLPEVAEWVENAIDEDDRTEVALPEPAMLSAPASTPVFDLGAHAARAVVPAAQEMQPMFEITAEQAPLAIDAYRFHEPSYRTTIRQLALAHITAEAPITNKRLSDLIARQHGFQRTGSQISSTVWDAVKNIPNCTRVSDGHTVYWPPDGQPQRLVPFRGLQVDGRDRLWKEVPLPERLGLVSALKGENALDLPRSVAEVIGYGRLTQSFRDEISELEKLLDPSAND
jgi:very-short-patch-repair endonuclease